MFYSTVYDYNVIYSFRITLEPKRIIWNTETVEYRNGTAFVKPTFSHRQAYLEILLDYLLKVLSGYFGPSTEKIFCNFCNITFPK